jgi:hypothetical protein
MRALQFWILLLGSSFVSILYVKQIFLSRDLNQVQRLLVESQEMISQGATYENAWKQLAMHIYQGGRQDPALAEVLKLENVDVHSTATAGAGSVPAATPVLPSTTIKAPDAQPHPSTP